MSARRERPAELDLATLPHWTRVEVRYGDLDVQGHVNNAVYFTYFEQGRVSFFAELRRLDLEHGLERGMEHNTEGEDSVSEPGDTMLTSADITFVIVAASCAYKQPITALAPVYVGIGAARVTHATVELRYAVCDKPCGAVYATGKTLLASVDLATGRPRPLPVWSRAGLARLLWRADAGAVGTSI